ncbi:hypothetical protein F4780DRAFT_783886 [Xylariomycetidae sp. FL0641]|nr:hypothetical protein F4780DRAFT_783886 [Xylariomycetidae sp. FL0641]
MPRDGSGHGDNAMELSKEYDHDIAHGTGEVKDSHVARADKTAPMPEAEHGKALKDMPASGGQSQGLAQGPDRGQGGRGSTN